MHRSSETAPVKVTNNGLCAHPVAYLSVAFDTVDHNILLLRLENLKQEQDSRDLDHMY